MAEKEAEVCKLDNYAIVCDQLDDLSIQILNTMQSIILERQYLDGNLKEGFINMAKSRYLMRGQKIGVLQINTTNLNASKKVISNLDIHDAVKFTSFGLSEKEKLPDVSHKYESHIHKGNLNEGSTTDEASTNILERNKNCDLEKISQNKTDVSPSVDNPLNWFGVLVPNSLKLCQTRFEQAIETSIKICTLQNKLNAFCEEYRRLRKQKPILYSSS